MRMWIRFGLLATAVSLFACTKKKKNPTDSSSGEASQKQEVAEKQFSEAEIMGDFKLPAGVEWQTNDTDPEYASPNAISGGTFHEGIPTFPMTLRRVGPDANGSFAGVLRSIQLSLLEIHPNTGRPIPQLASHWAFDKDGVTVFYKLNPNARWSDGKPITPEDYTFTQEFHRSKSIVDPWYNRHYTENIKDIKKISNYVISVTGAKAYPKEDLLYFYGVGPTPRHFHVLDDKWVENYNWKVEPVSGPYQITQVDKGKQIVLDKVPSWWGRRLRYYRNRFNVDQVVYTVIRDINAQWEYFKKGEIDSMGITLPEYWHEKSANEDMVKRGFIQRLWFYNDAPRSDMGMFLNLAQPIFKDKNVRYALAHAMNLDKVLKEVLRSDYERLNFISRGYGDFTNQEIKPREFDPAKVATLMQKSGWKRGADGVWAKSGKRFSVTVTYGQPHHKDRLVVLQQEAKKCGIELNLEELDGSASFKKMREKKHDIAWVGWGTSMRPQYWEFFHSDNANKSQTNNLTNTSDPKIDTVVKKYEDSFDLKEKAALSREVQSLIFEEGSIITTFQVPYFRQAFWRYWKLPDVPATKISEDALDPLGSATGGLFWFDKKAYDETQEAKASKKSFEPVTAINREFKAK